VALNTTPYNVQTAGPHSMRFFNDSGVPGAAWVAYEDLIGALGVQDWATRIGSGGTLPGSVLSGDPVVSNAAISRFR
jgi:hypothetical protein